ncbi:ABC transporter permease [Paenibacillus sp. N1-5-1-14]|uniref:oligopeptide ABC transporter permease n=1 Tax=Paenibacillus radicibacter TaxID=2972488 RepID=UPI00215942C6|nr:oligopeptide ABC transporter permease [Paenibacillus radicibacter]MCR8641610.1 ABC transporter permease [Paenibacillus radicibacter]
MSLEVTPSNVDAYKKTKNASSPWKSALRRLRKNKLAMLGLILLVLMFTICFIGPLLSPFTADDPINIIKGNKAPNSTNLFGTDNLGRDILLRTMLSGRISLLVGIIVAVINVLIGSTLGAIAGYYKGFVDTIIMRIADVINSIPGLPLLIILGTLLSDMKIPPDQRIYIVMLLLGFLSWPSLARLVRGQILTLREQEFMLATEALGLRDRRKIFRHLLPNTVPIIIVVATLSVAGAILSESTLSFLGLGVVPPTPSWGNMITAALTLLELQKRPWIWIPPGVFIIITVLAINFIGDGLRDALDPKMKR